MQINSLTLTNFRKFTNLSMVFDPRLTVIVGPNCSGKSTIVDALAVPLEYVAHCRVSSIPLQLSGADVRVHKDGSWTDDTWAGYEFQFGESRLPLEVYYAQRRENPYEHSFYTSVRHAVSQFVMPVLVRYSARRGIGKWRREATSHAGGDYAYKNAFEPDIDFSTTMTWFIEKSVEEALKGKRKGKYDFTLPDLEAVRLAVSRALGDYDKPFVDETPPRIRIVRFAEPGVSFSVEGLSHGSRALLTLVMDLARRMAQAATNSAIHNILEFPAVVLIDEIELHLHPALQQRLLPTLLEIFPRTQFIVTTHSPQIISFIDQKHVRLLSQEGITLPPSEITGPEGQKIMEEVFGVSPKYPENEGRLALDKFFGWIKKEE